MKKRIAALLGIALLTFCVPAMAAEQEAVAGLEETPMQSSYQVAIDGEDTEVEALVMVPVRALANSLGWTVAWLGDGEVYLDSKNYHTIITVGVLDYEVGSYVMDYVKTSIGYRFETAPVIIDGVTYAPLGLFQALLGNGEDVITMENGVVAIHTDRVIPSVPTEYESLEALRAAVNFEIPMPQLGEGYILDSYFVVNGKLAEINWSSDLGDVSYRVSQGEEYNSGVFMHYPTTESVMIEEIDVVIRGIGSQVQIAEWTHGGQAYSLFFEYGIHELDLRQMVTALLKTLPA